MVKFVYNNSKNASTGHIFFKLNCSYHLRISFKDKYDARSRFFSAKKLAIELRKLINVSSENLLHAQDVQKQAHDKRVKSWRYAPGEKIWLNSKYIKTKKNRKLKAKFFRSF